MDQPSKNLPENSSPPPSHPQVDPSIVRWHWQSGTRYLLETETETTMSLEPLGRPGDQVLTMKQLTRIDVTTASDRPTTKHLRVSYESMTGQLSAAGKTFHYDSQDIDNSHMALRQMLSSSVGHSFVMRYSAEDRYTELVSAEQPAASPGQPAGLMEIANAREVAELFRRSLEMGLPRPPVAVGDKWTSLENITFPQAGDMEVKLKCHYAETVQREGRPHAKITFEGEIGRAPTRVENPVEDNPLLLGEGSTLSGQIFFDLERRVVSLSVFVSNLSLIREGKPLPVRQSVSTRLKEVLPGAATP